MYLIAYSTREGQTKKIANFIQTQLGEQHCELIDLTKNEVIEWANYEKVLVGASIRYGKFPVAFYQWIDAHQKILTEKKACFFSVNLTARKKGKDTPEGSKYIQTFLKKSPWQPEKIGVFAGALYYPRYSWFDRQMIRFIMTITGGETDTSKEVEYTDWDKVREFTESFRSS